MRRRRSLVPLFALAAACGGAPDGSPRDVAAVADVMQAYVEARTAGDVPRLMRLMTDDAVLLPAGEPAVTASKVTGWFRWYYEVYTMLSQTATIDETIIMGDWAYARGTYALEHQAVDEPAVAETGTFARLFRRQPDGSWKLARDMWTVTHTSEAPR